MSEIFNWKLSTAADYFQVAALLIISFIVLYIFTKLAQKKRHKASAIKRVARRLTQSVKKGGAVRIEPALLLGEQPHNIDLILADQAGVLLIEVFGRGIEVYGQPRSETWKIADRERSASVENPILRLDKNCLALKAYLAKEGLNGVSIQPLAVFADNFEEPQIFLGRTEVAVSFEKLKAFLKNRSNHKQTHQTADLVAALDKIITKQEGVDKE